MPEEPVFDLESVFNAEIEPLLDRLQNLCDAYGVPMFAVFCVRACGDGTGRYCRAEVARDDWASPAIRDAKRTFDTFKAEPAERN